jgi:hypothetical protein
MYLKIPGDTLAAMTIENILLYVGIGLIVFGFVSYLVCMHMERYYDRKLYELQQSLKNKFGSSDYMVWLVSAHVFPSYSRWIQAKQSDNLDLCLIKAADVS